MAWPWNKDGQQNPPNSDDKNQSKSEVDQLVEKLTGHFDAKIQPLAEGYTALKADFDALKAAATTPPRREGERTEEPPTLTSFADDADRAFAERIGPLAVQTARLSARVSESEALRQVEADGWAALIPDIKKHLEATPLQRKAAPDYGAYVENVVSMVIGASARKAGLRMDGSKKTFYLEDAASRGTNPPSTFGADANWVDQKGRVHSAEETLSKLGVDPTQFAKEFPQA